MQRAVDNRETLRLEHRILRSDGTVRWVEAYANCKLKNGEDVLAGFVRDITDRKTFEERLAESRSQLQLALWGADVGTWDIDLSSGRSTIDPRFFPMLGRAPHEAESTMAGWLALVHPEDLPKVQGAVAAHSAGETAAFEVEHRLRHKSGHWVWVLARGRAIRDEQGRPVRASGTFLDISDRKRVAVEGIELLKKFERLVSQLDAPRSSIAGKRASSSPSGNRLTRRNREILQLIADGRTTAQIARQLSISESTAKTHRRNLMRKLGLSNKADLIRYAIRHGVVSD